MKEDARGPVAEGDLLAIIDYLDGRLAPEERIALELRLADSPELGVAFDEFEALDHLQRRVASGGGKRRSRILSGGPALVLTAAAALLLLIAAHFLGWLPGRADPSRVGAFEVAILPTRTTAGEFLEALGLSESDRNSVPGGFYGASRGAGTEPEGAAANAAGSALLSLQERWVSEGFEGRGTDGPAEFFVVPVRPEREASALVLLADDGGNVRGREGDGFLIAYPETVPWAAEIGRLEAGRVRLLPRAVVLPEAADSGRLAAYAPGFLVPMGIRRLTVLVALRAEPLDEALRESLNVLLKALSGEAAATRDTPARLRAWLEERGFEVVERELEAA